MRCWHRAALLVILVMPLACDRAVGDLHARLQRAQLEAELSFGRSTVFVSEPPSLETLERVDWEGLLAAVLKGAPHERWRAIEILGELKHPQAVPVLLQALADRRGTVRPCLAAQSLGRLRDSSAVDSLIVAARNADNEDLRLCAIKALGLLRDERALPALIESVEARDMVVAASFALARIGHPSGAHAVARATEDPALRAWLVAPLGEFGLPEVEAALRGIASDGRSSEATLRAAREGLWKTTVLTEPDPPAALVRVLAASPEPRRREWAAFRLGELGEGAVRSAAPALAGALSDPSEPVRLAAAVALMRLGPASEPSLLRLIDVAGSAGRYALATLGFVGGPQTRVALQAIHDPKRTVLARHSLRWLRLRRGPLGRSASLRYPPRDRVL